MSHSKNEDKDTVVIRIRLNDRLELKVLSARLGIPMTELLTLLTKIGNENFDYLKEKVDGN